MESGLLRNRILIVNNKVFRWLLILISSTLLYSKLFNSFLIILLTCSWLIGLNFQLFRDSLKKDRVLISFLIFFMLNLVGIIYSQNYGTAFKHLEKQLSVLIIPLIILTSDRRLDSVELERVKLGFIISVILGCFWCHGHALYYLNHWGLDFTYLVSYKYTHSYLSKYLNIHPSYFSIYVSITILVLLSNSPKVWTVRHKYVKALYLFLLLYLVIFNFLLASVTILIIFVILVFYHVFNNYPKSKVVIGLMILLLIFAGVFKGKFGYVTTRFYEKTFEAYFRYLDIDNDQLNSEAAPPRYFEWQCAIRQLRFPTIIYGYGTGDVQDQLNSCYADLDLEILLNSKFNSHNQYLDVLLRFGIIGLCTFSMMLFCLIKTAYRANHMVFIYFIAIFLFSFLSENTLARQKGVVLFALLCSIFVLESRKKRIEF